MKTQPRQHFSNKYNTCTVGRPKKNIEKCLVSGNLTDPLVLSPTQNFFCHNLHSVKIGNLHCAASVQREHGKTGAQVNHVVFFFFSNVYIGDQYSQKCADIIAGFITFTKYKSQFCNTVPSVSLFKVPDETPAIYVHNVTSILVRNNFHLFVNKHLICLTWCLPCDYFGGNNKFHKLFYFYVWFLFIIFQ